MQGRPDGITAPQQHQDAEIVCLYASGAAGYWPAKQHIDERFNIMEGFDACMHV